ncbi:hypothetical protein VTL71DRAFT_12649 [Oculimacula yallundae]|uniref:Uncharacterized protein n=1 Tax=Oculimacula yallundae TaxID=86028 RepID=A0ABR4CNM8_9HELO
MNLKLRHSYPREVSERKQVGDAESMINEGRGASGHHGFFKGEGGEVLVYAGGRREKAGFFVHIVGGALIEEGLAGGRKGV